MQYRTLASHLASLAMLARLLHLLPVVDHAKYHFHILSNFLEKIGTFRFFKDICRENHFENFEDKGSDQQKEKNNVPELRSRLLRVSALS